MEKIPIVFASECESCDCCEEPWCLKHQQHYADCGCVGPHNAEELGYTLIEENGRLYGIKK